MPTTTASSDYIYYICLFSIHPPFFISELVNILSIILTNYSFYVATLVCTANY
jgi:hypothetical protein